MGDDLQPTAHQQGQFVRTAWYSRGLEHGNPYFNERFRVNAPETSLTPAWMYRSEARENGMMLIRIDEDLALLERAEIYAEIWGGHPGTAGKRLSINGRSTYALPEVGTSAGHCTYSYPRIPLKLTDLVNGYNAVQFACDIGNGFWGHFIVDNAALNVVLQRKHADLMQLGLTAFEAAVAVESVPEHEDAFHIRLMCLPDYINKIARVDFIGHYSGYDENGNNMDLDWHGYTKNREPEAIIGTSVQPPFAAVWDTTMLTAQPSVTVRAVVHFLDVPNLVYTTPCTSDLNIPRRKHSLVTHYLAKNQPKPFWSRDSTARKCAIWLDFPPVEIERAELHVVIWDGGAGTMNNPFTINGHPLPVAGSGDHDVLYRRILVNPDLLRHGANEILLLSDTEHHGIEILLPGPCLVVHRKRH